MTIFKVTPGSGNVAYKVGDSSSITGAVSVAMNQRLREDLSHSMNTERRIYKEEHSFREKVRTENTLFVSPDSDLEQKQKADEFTSSISRFLF